MSFDAVDDVITEGREFEEVVLHLDGQTGRVEVPVAIVADRQADGRLIELRVYHSMWPVVGHHVHRPPMLQRAPELHASDVVAEYQHALAAGDLDAILATFEPDAYAREPAGGGYVHRGRDGLRAFYEHMFSNGGAIPLEHCTMLDSGRACLLEYNVVTWGRTELPPEAGWPSTCAARPASSRLPGSTTIAIRRSNRAATTVDVHRLAGDGGGLVEVEDRVGDVANRSAPGDWARCDRVHAHTAPRELDGQRARDGREAALRQRRERRRWLAFRHRRRGWR